MTRIYLQRGLWFSLLTWLASWTLLAMPAQAAAATLDPDFYAPNLPTGANHYRVGIATHPWWLDMHTETFIQNFKQLKVGIVRLPVEWKVIEPEPGRYDWSVDDRLLNRLNDEGFEIVAEFVTIPPWASSNPAECAKTDLDCGFNSTYADHFQAAVETTARRYPFIRYWEFWNEPEQWANAGRDPDLYASWLKLFYQAIKRADPTMLVAATTLAGWDYLNILYTHFNQTGDAPNYPWDAIAYHPYNLDMEQDENGTAYIAKKRLQKIRQMMIEHGEAAKPIWITEISFEGSPASESQQMVAAFDWLVQQDYVAFIVLHMLHDWTEQNVGLMTTSPETFKYRGVITPQTKFYPKQPYYDTFKDYPKRARPTLPPSTADRLVFPQSGHTLRGIFKKTWEEKGGLSLFGYPKTDQFYERNPADGKYYLVQYFERVRMEYHPDLQGTPYAVEYGLLGNEMLVKLGLFDKKGQPSASQTQPETPQSGPKTEFFPQTGHNLSGLFRQEWQRLGGLSVIGYPRTSVYTERSPGGELLQIQYFERARLELHTAPDGHQFVLLGLLANERLVDQGRLLPNYQPDDTNYYNPANFEFAYS